MNRTHRLRRIGLFGLALGIAACSSTPSRPPDGRGRDRSPAPLDASVDRPPVLDRSDDAIVVADRQRDALAPDQGPAGPLVIHFKKPSDWADAKIHYWKTWPDNQGTSWPGTSMTGGTDGWTTFDLSPQTSAGIVFDDGTGKQTVDLWRERSGWFVPRKVVRGLLTGRWYDRDPRLYPRVSATPPGGNLYGEEIVTLDADGDGVKTRRFTLDGSDPKSGGMSFASGDKISVGASLSVGQSLTLRVWADGPAGDDQRTFTFQRVAAPPIEAWDKVTAPQSVSKNGRWVSLTSFPSPQGLLSRNVVIFLPADYDTSTNEHYPVIYFHDGQNLVDAGDPQWEWMIDERYDELDAEGLISPAIVVGIYNTGDDREAEYCSDAGGKRVKYENWVVHTLKPYIDEHYRTKPQAEHTATMGSSYGGIISHRIAWDFTSVFGAALMLSTQFEYCGGMALAELQGYTGGKKPIRYWIDAGSAEYANPPDARGTYIANNRIAAEILAKNGWNEGTDLAYLEIPGGQHSQTSWQKRIKKVLYFWLGKDPARIARIDVRTFLSSINVGGVTWASFDLQYENDLRFTKLFGDTAPPYTFTSSDPTRATLDATTGQVVGKASGTLQLNASYQSFNLGLPFTVN